MTSDFPFDIAPFDSLSATQRAQFQTTVRQVGFARDALILSPETEPAHAFVLTCGHVQLSEAGEGIAVYTPGELFAVRAVLSGRCSGSLIALDAVDAWQIPKALLLECIHSNAAFSAALFVGLGGQLQAGEGRRRDREFLALMMVPIREAFIRPPHFVDGSLDIVSVCRQLSALGLTNTLVRDPQADGERIGMFTTTDLRDALLQPLPPAELPVARVAQFDLVAIGSDAALFDALLMMIRHRVHRILVRDGSRIVGVLSQLDLMGFVSNHSHLIALQVAQAQSVDALRQAALQIDSLIEVLHSGGARIEVIAGLVSELNSQVFARLWALLAPPDLVANSCLLVMGSEGRGEQILKTDQDNALLLRDGVAFPGLEGIAQAFNAALAELGYPRCPGDIMLTNPLWRQPLAAFCDTLRGWLYGPTPGNDGPMHLAIFFDAAAVAGDATLLEQAREYLTAVLSDNDAFLARFAAAADQFPEPGGWFTRLVTRRDEQPLDLKKLGTFPIVHGVRALSLQYRVRETGTVARLGQLAAQQNIGHTLARDLCDALHALMQVRLAHQLRQRQRGETPGNEVRPSALEPQERVLLRDALAVVKGFRQFLRQHYHLDLL